MKKEKKREQKKLPSGPILWNGACQGHKVKSSSENDVLFHIQRMQNN